MKNIYSNLEILTVTFKSEHIIESCLSKIDNNFKITIVENSDNLDFKKKMEKRENVRCILANENIGQKTFKISSKKMLKLLNKTKISISNDETRHYLNGIYLHKTNIENKSFLSGVATDSHRLSFSSLEIDPNTDFLPIILPKKTIFQLISLLEQSTSDIKISNNKSKIKFEINSGVLISKVIDGRFPDYSKVIPKNN